MNSIRAFSRRVALAAALCVLSGPFAVPAQAQSQTWPQRGVKFMLPFGAGSATDVAARLIGERLATKWGKPVVIENRPGADGLLAIQAFTSANDDHVLLYASSASFIAHPYTQEHLPYVLERDLEPIARVAETILTVSVPADTNINTDCRFRRSGTGRAAEVQRRRRAGPARIRGDGVSQKRKSWRHQAAVPGHHAGRP